MSLELKTDDEPSSLDDICQKMIDFYSNRLEKGLVAEKDNSIFSKGSYDYAKAKQVIKSNPLAVLQKDKVVYYNSESQRVGFTSRYCPNDSEVSTIKQICIEKINGYYEELVSSNQTNHSESKNIDACNQVIKAIDELESILSTINDSDKIIESRKYIYNLRQIWDKNNIPQPLSDNSEDTDTNSEGKTESTVLSGLELIKETDPRRIGKLVRETMTYMEKNEFSFEDELLKKMQNPAWSKTTLKLYYPFLKKYDSAISLNLQIRDKLGNGRYWKQVFSFSGSKFIITSEWYKESKPLFIKWYNSLVLGENLRNQTITP